MLSTLKRIKTNALGSYIPMTLNDALVTKGDGYAIACFEPVKEDLKFLAYLETFVARQKKTTANKAHHIKSACFRVVCAAQRIHYPVFLVQCKGNVMLDPMPLPSSGIDDAIVEQMLIHEEMLRKLRGSQSPSSRQTRLSKGS